MFMVFPFDSLIDVDTIAVFDSGLVLRVDRPEDLRRDRAGDAETPAARTIPGRG
jgi:hypothetical protein